MATGLAFTWTGADGSVWDLNDDATGVCLQEGVRGLSMPPVSQYRSESPMVAGSRYRGTRVLQREVFWPLRIWHDGTPSEFAVRDRAFWHTLDPSKVGTWKVTRPSGGFRTLGLRYESDDGVFEVDPLLYGYSTYGVNLVAEQPFWSGDDVVKVFTATGSQTIDNDGDVPAWLTWTMEGPISTGAHIGMTNAHILIPAAIGSGRTLTVYTQPDLMVALWDDGTELVLDSSPDDYTIGARFASIPTNGLTTLSTLQSGGTITATMTPYFFRAY